MNALAREPTRAGFVAAFAVAVLLRLGVHVDPLVELAIDFGSLWFCAEVTRCFTSPATPRAAALPAPQGAPMSPEDFVAKIKTDVGPLLAGAHDLWRALPADFQHAALEPVKSGVDALLAALEADVEKVVPPSLDGLIESAKAAIQARADAQIAALEGAKQAAA